MRQIKFRAWDKDDKVMISEPLNLDRCREDKENTILMQFTGLKDKNGKEIYEGDVVICDRFEDHVQWELEIKDIRFLPDELGGSNLNWREVIGNIYENPELLEDKK